MDKDTLINKFCSEKVAQLKKIADFMGINVKDRKLKKEGIQKKLIAGLDSQNGIDNANRYYEQVIKFSF